MSLQTVSSILLILSVTFFGMATELPAQIEKQRLMQDANRIFNRSEFKQFRAQAGNDTLPSSGSTSSSSGSGSGSEGGPSAGSGSSSGSGGSGTPGKSSSDNSAESSSSSSGSGGYSGMGSFGDFGAGLAGLFKLLGILAVAAMLILVVWLIATTFLNRERRAETGDYEGFLDELASQPESGKAHHYSVQEALNYANKFAHEGKYREAIAFVLFAAMSWTEAEGYIRPRRGLTHRDYSRALRRQQEASQAYRQILKLYEPLGFGRREATKDHYVHAMQEFQKGFRETSTLSEN